MEVHQLKYFVAVAEAKSFSRAAERMRVAQPSLSQQIQKLEGEVGQPLFNRLSRGAALTEAGDRLLIFARRILTDLGDARRCVADYREETAGAASVGIIPTIAPYVLRRALTTFKAEHPQVTISVLEDVTDNLVRALENGDIDFAIVSSCRNGSAMHREVWVREPLVLALPEGHQLERCKRLSSRDLPGDPLLMLHESHCLSQQIARWCGRNGISRQATLPAVQLSTVLTLVAARQGISLVPTMAIAHEKGGGCSFVSLGSLAPHRDINVMRNPARFRSRAAMAFEEVVREAVLNAVKTSNKPRGR